jgi:hypothetical protein
VNEGFLRDRLHGNEIVCTAVRAGRGEPTVMARHPHLKVSGKHRGLGTFLWGFPIIALVWFAFSSVPVNADPPSDMRTMSVKERAELGEKLVFGIVGDR